MNEAVFKTTMMGGFNKSEVLAFIDKQDEQWKEREKDLNARIDSLSTGLKNETLRSEELAKKAQELQSLLDIERENCARALDRERQASDETMQIKAELEEELSARDKELALLQKELAQKSEATARAQEQAAIAVSHAAALENKLALIDKTEEQIGRAMLEAQQTADKIVKTAQKDAQDILTNANDSANFLMEQTRERAGRLSDDAHEKLDALLRRVSEYKERVGGMHGEISEFFASVNGAFDSMQDGACQFLGHFESAFEKQLSDLAYVAAAQAQPDAESPDADAQTGEAGAQEDCACGDEPEEAPTSFKFDFSAAD